MNYKWIGAVLVIVGCGGFGFSLAATQLREESNLRQLIRMLKFMERELRYRLTPLPQLCRQASGEGKGAVRDVMKQLATELERQEQPDVSSCMRMAMERSGELSRRMRRLLSRLGRCLGRFDIEGQLEGLEEILDACREQLKDLQSEKRTRLKSYRTLGLCTGAALVILFL